MQDDVERGTGRMELPLYSHIEGRGFEAKEFGKLRQLSARGNTGEVLCRPRQERVQRCIPLIQPILIGHSRTLYSQRAERVENGTEREAKTHG